MKEDIDILVIDDDPDLCMLMETILKFDGHNVRRSCNPAEISNLLEKYKPTMLVMDMLLSGMDGREITAGLKADAATNHIKILMVSAHPDAAPKCLAAGADAFISKPFDMDEFTATVGQMLAAAA